jgi:hypothetical protein
MISAAQGRKANLQAGNCDMASKSKTKISARRKPLSPRILDMVHAEAGYMCANPRCQKAFILEAHHIVWVKAGGGDDISNLLALCPTCHSAHTKGMISKEAIYHWKAILVSLNHVIGREGIDLLLYIQKLKTQTMFYSSGELLPFRRLIVSGLLEVAETQSLVTTSGSGTFTNTSHRLAITERGVMIMEAWIDGNSSKYFEVISHPWT